MKKIITISLCAALVFGLSACGTPPPSSSNAPSASVTPPPPESVESSSSQQESSLPPIPADAAMYRGTVTEVSSTSSSSSTQAPVCEFTLEQAEGTNFGAPSLKFAFTADTKADFTPEKGQYLEVYYGVAMGQPLDATAVHNVITAIKYHSADMVNYNGYVKDIQKSADHPGQGWIMMVSTPEELSDSSGVINSSQVPIMTTGNEIRYNYDQNETKFYLNFDEIKVGDRLNIFRSGAMTMSLPPQCFAIEVRLYAEPAAK